MLDGNGVPVTQGASGYPDTDSFENFFDSLKQLIAIDHDLEELDRQHDVIGRDRATLTSRRVALVTAINATYRRAGTPTCSMQVGSRHVVIEKNIITTRPSRTPASIHAASRSAAVALGLDSLRSLPRGSLGTLDGDGFGDLSPHPAAIGECGQAVFTSPTADDD